MSEVGPWGSRFGSRCSRRAISRRDFLQFCTMAAAAAGLAVVRPAQVVSAFEKKEKPAVVWMHFQECTCCSESFIRASHPIVADALLDVSVAELHRDADGGFGIPGGEEPDDTIKNNKGKYILAGGRRGADGQRRRVLHGRRQDGAIDPADGGGGCGSGGGLGCMRIQRLRAGGQAQSDRRTRDFKAGEQAGDQRAGLPADRGRDDGAW